MVPALSISTRTNWLLGDVYSPRDLVGNTETASPAGLTETATRLYAWRPNQGNPSARAGGISFREMDRSVSKRPRTLTKNHMIISSHLPRKFSSLRTRPLGHSSFPLGRALSVSYLGRGTLPPQHSPEGRSRLHQDAPAFSLPKEKMISKS